MGSPVANINPDILVWARHSSGLSISDVAERFKKEESVVLEWEQGSKSPTYAQLEKLAYQVYKRPLAVFFFSEPPDEESPQHSFRTLPGFEIENLNSRVRFLRREALAMQGFVSELLGGSNEAWTAFAKQCSFLPGDSASTLAIKVRELLKVDFAQQKAWKSTEEAFEDWRNAVEQVGVYVFKEAFGQEALSAFCLFDDLFPVIYINNSTPKSRQIFSLFHELGHLLAGTGGITTANDSFVDSLPENHREIEIFCNQFAAEVLVSREYFNPSQEELDISDANISATAKIFNVSREVILRRILDAGRVSKEYYESKVQEWTQEYKSSKAKKKPGGNYYATLRAYNDETLSCT